ncbi:MULTISPECIES: TolC family protein [Bacteroidales]|uniref:TolC family protein n=1 Tax=Bacteroidales TaxID=171549 RepID=UPI0005743392|nr:MULTISPECIES: TolC family protein [Bacteroidales]KHM45723.1 membrane protein [Coprobacter secundus]
MKKIIIYIIILLLYQDYSFGQSYTLEQCLQMALENNYKLKKAQNNIKSSEQDKKEAFTKYFPNISAVGGTYKTNNGMAEISLAPLVLGMEMSMMKDGIVAGISAIQPIFTGGQIYLGNKLTEIGTEISKYQLKQTEDEIILTVNQYYWQLVSLQEKIKTIEIMESLINNIQNDVKNAVDAGITNQNDLLQIQLKKNNIASSRLQLENGIRLSKMVLGQYIGDFESNFDIISPQQDSLPSPITYRINHIDALPSLNAYQLVNKNVEASKLQQKMKIGQNMPTLGIGAGYFYHDLLNQDHSFGMIFASVTVPISNWWGGTHAIKKQKIQVKNAELTRQNTREMLLIQMQKCWNELEESYKQMNISKESISVANENFRLNKEYYKAGTISLSDMLEAQSLLQQSRDQYTEDYTLYLIKRTQYLQATGQNSREGQTN